MFRFNYDARNRCVSRTINGVTSYQTYAGWSLLEDRSDTGALLARYIHGGGSDEVLATVGAGGTWYHLQDALGRRSGGVRAAFWLNLDG